MQACTFANLWNLTPGERAGQPGERPMAVKEYIAAGHRFFQFEIPVLNNGVTKRTTSNSGPLSPQPVNSWA